MIRTCILAIVALNLLASCASRRANQPYQAVTKAEHLEFCKDRLDVYPDDVRKHPDRYTNTAVVWTGLVVSTDAHDMDRGSKVIADTVFEHHYFDWVQEGKGHNAKFAVSPRGEGKFFMRWYLDKTTGDANYHNAEKYAAKGNFAIVYGSPESVDTNGVVTLKYRYIRIIDQDHFSTNEFDYGRFGEGFQVLPGCPAK